MTGVSEMIRSNLIASTFLVIAMATTAGAQGAVEVTVDMSKYTCEQMLQPNQNSIEVAIWLSGYYNGLRKNTKLNLGQFAHNAELVVDACHSAPNKTVMETINKLLSEKK
jgi:hypothetical protein